MHTALIWTLSYPFLKPLPQTTILKSLPTPHFEMHHPSFPSFTNSLQRTTQCGLQQLYLWSYPCFPSSISADNFVKAFEILCVRGHLSVLYIHFVFVGSGFSSFLLFLCDYLQENYMYVVCAIHMGVFMTCTCTCYSVCCPQIFIAYALLHKICHTCNSTCHSSPEQISCSFTWNFTNSVKIDKCSPRPSCTWSQTFSTHAGLLTPQISLNIHVHVYVNLVTDSDHFSWSQLWLDWIPRLEYRILRQWIWLVVPWRQGTL